MAYDYEVEERIKRTCFDWDNWQTRLFQFQSLARSTIL